MSSILIVGGDRLGVIPEKLRAFGYTKINHISGRKVKMVKKQIPYETNSILILTDYINHNMLHSIKKQAASQKIPVYFAKRSWSYIEQSLRA
ncbi:DUF2325 domain-containing protein [Alkalihalobacillus oceani]|uniref:DUF2325 domain-containing protein n=1 Tax=Halalkalibacter oceani TaxID=1653776 RepID=UPI00203EEB0F|nr:DUF2325 domain-containing protein [Halalkalibacter oceani]MCM3760175.1 DUF2325 domain-containing protein [Halalkalibacter oceani]